MCATCGCDHDAKVTISKPGADHHHHVHTHEREIKLEEDVLQQNNLLAERNRGFLEAKNIFCVNLVSSPGSGKTTLLEKTIKSLADTPLYVIEGDQQTFNDANRIEAAGAQVVQVNTGNGCHLDANMVHQALHELKPENDSTLIIENVGNLVCPSLFDLGEAHRVVMVSVTEGEDKPLKYPNMFATSQVCVINKTDLLPYVDFDVDKFKGYALQINPDLKFMELSATKGDNLENWTDWLTRHSPMAVS